ncbi:MAG TPA: M20/M25/M40 family metallo-hydrolase [Solirubrobacterales bacterium]|nr:M20/M25/M40 family metallo-hydrolase [Solirubrobacterales bacterium]
MKAPDLLQQLIRFNTVNPPGNEGPALKFLKGPLEAAGWQCKLLSKVDDRPNLVARLRGAEPGPNLALISHVDTVPADPGEWSRDPWSGDLVDGYIWGRGALDMKDQVAAETAACINLAETGWRPARGDLILVVAADEETGAHFGARWLCEECPDEVRCDWVLNEGAGELIDFDGRKLFTLSVGEKGTFRFTVVAEGEAGHGSIPRVGVNALLKLGPALANAHRQPPHESTPDTDLFLERLLGHPVEDTDEALREIETIDPLVAKLLADPMLGVTLAPTMARASNRENVIPSRAELVIDCRTPPGMTGEQALERINSILGEGDWKIIFNDPVVGNRSDYGGPLAEAIEEWVELIEPGARVLPQVMPGFSDSHWFRKAFGATVFGFAPQRMSLAETKPLVHGADERIKVEDVELMENLYRWLPPRLLGTASDESS